MLRATMLFRGNLEHEHLFPCVLTEQTISPLRNVFEHCWAFSCTYHTQGTSIIVILSLKDFLQLITISRPAPEHSDTMNLHYELVTFRFKNIGSSKCKFQSNNIASSTNSRCIVLMVGLLWSKLYGGHMLNSILSIIPIMRSEIWG